MSDRGGELRVLDIKPRDEEQRARCLEALEAAANAVRAGTPIGVMVLIECADGSLDANWTGIFDSHVRRLGALEALKLGWWGNRE